MSALTSEASVRGVFLVPYGLEPRLDLRAVLGHRLFPSVRSAQVHPLCLLPCEYRPSQVGLLESLLRVAVRSRVPFSYDLCAGVDDLGVCVFWVSLAGLVWVSVQGRWTPNSFSVGGLGLTPVCLFDTTP